MKGKKQVSHLEDLTGITYFCTFLTGIKFFLFSLNICSYICSISALIIKLHFKIPIYIPLSIARKSLEFFCRVSYLSKVMRLKAYNTKNFPDELLCCFFQLDSLLGVQIMFPESTHSRVPIDASLRISHGFDFKRGLIVSLTWLSRPILHFGELKLFPFLPFLPDLLLSILFFAPFIFKSCCVKTVNFERR